MKSNWPIKKLKEVIESLESGSRPKGGVKHILSGIPSIGAEHLNNNGGFSLDKIKYIPNDFYNSLKRGLIKQNDILIVKDGATTGKVSLVNHNFPFKVAAVNEHIFILSSNKNLISPLFLFYFLFSKGGKEQILETFHGMAQGGISSDFINHVDIPLPSLTEQKKIVEKLELLLGKIKEAKRLREESIKTTQNLLSSELHKIFNVGKKMGWNEDKLENIAKSVADGTHDTPLYQQSGYPLVTSKNLRPEGLTFKTAKLISEKDHIEINKRSQVSKGDLLVGMIGTIGNITKVNTIKQFSIKNVGLIRPNNNKVLAEYIAYYLDNSRLHDLITIGGTTQKFISLGMLRNIRIIFPAIYEQKKIVERLDLLSEKIRKLQENQKKSAEDLELLEQSILHQTFKN